MEMLSNIVFGLALLFTGSLMIGFAVDPAAAAHLLMAYVTGGVL